ncbi:MAG: type IV pilus modification protein PilV [Pseudomonadota bacterium]|nr:type IV pilus modification protein PilV [Pseudomonadota bacterium]
MKSNTKQKGIGLIEIMVALVVVAIGILGIAQLQNKVVRNASDANARAIAAVLAQKKVDQLRSFNFLSTANPEYGAGDFAFEEITSEAANSVTDALSNTEFQISTNLIGNYYYGATDLTSATTSGTGTPDYKVVEVIVAWTDIDNSSQELKVRTLIDGYPPQFSSLKGNATVGADPPLIPYTPEAAPDVVPVTLETDEGLKKETNKPLPDVSKKGFSIATTFESVTYNSVLDTVRREEFLTLSCRCGPGPNVNNHLWGRTVWDPQNLKLKDETYDVTLNVTKSAVDDGGGEAQAPECSVCCRDSADTSQAADGGYYKSCRLKRIDGVMRYYQPWKLIAFNVIPASFFDDDGLTGMDQDISQANIDKYSDYVTDLVRDRLALTSADFNASKPDKSFAPDNFLNGAIDHLLFSAGGSARQIQARAVYMDYPPDGIYDECGAGPCDETDVPLDRVSFNEVNITNLAGWMPDRNRTSLYATDGAFVNYTQDHDAIGNPPSCLPSAAPPRAFVTNDELKNGCETKLSRGVYNPGTVTASTAVQTIVFESNDGLINRPTNAEGTVTTQIELITQ